jgi:chemotaxis response regulator CheB
MNAAHRAVLAVLIVEDSLDIQRRLREMLEAVPAVEVVGCVGNAVQALPAGGGRRADVVALDGSLRDGDHGPVHAMT